MKNTFLRIKALLFIGICVSSSLYSQSRIPPEYRGIEDAIARGVVNGNQIETNFRNHGEMSRWNDIPWGVWPKNTGGKHIDGIGFIMAGRVAGERAKWFQYYGEGATDTTLNPVIINYRQSGARLSPYTGNRWGWLPLNGFANQFRQNIIDGSTEVIPAMSLDDKSWPSFWPDRLGENIDSGWEGVWNGFRGKGLVTGDLETFYVMDDYSDKEYAANIEIEGPHSNRGVYYPSPTDSSIGGLGLQTEVRTFQFNHLIAEDMLFIQYRTTNVSEKDIPETWTAMIIDVGLGNEENDDNAELRKDLNLIMAWDSDGIGNSTTSVTYNLGYIGFLLLEHSIDEQNGIDEDNDGMIDESKFNGPGELLKGKAAIDEYLSINYDMDVFTQNFQDLSLFPAYQNEVWWTGDEDLDWVGFSDENRNDLFDEGEELNNDVGRDGIGPNDENYTGPDEGEGDGIPTQGEPNFGEQDMLEAENLDLGLFDLSSRPIYESGDNLRDDTWLFNKIQEAQFDENTVIENGVIDEEPMILFGTKSFSLKSGSSSYFTTVLIFGEDEADVIKKAKQAKAIYESDYGQSPLVTSNEEEAIQEKPEEFSLSQNYPNPFNPTTNIEFSLSKMAPVSLTVFDITGREVQSLISDKTYSSGVHTVQLNAGNLASGIYIYRLEVAGEVFTKKLTLIK